jgi:hypothetical protein
MKQSTIVAGIIVVLAIFFLVAGDSTGGLSIGGVTILPLGAGPTQGTVTTAAIPTTATTVVQPVANTSPTADKTLESETKPASDVKPIVVQPEDTPVASMLFQKNTAKLNVKEWFSEKQQQITVEDWFDQYSIDPNEFFKDQ